MKKITKILVLLLAINVTAMAQTAVAPAAGDGSDANPYEIASLDNLYWITQNSNVWDNKHFIQTQDINATTPAPIEWNPIGSAYSTVFSGEYDGNNKKIENLNITLISPWGNQVFFGVFGYVDNGGIIKNLGLVNVNVVSNAYEIGALVGIAYDITIENCYSTGNVEGEFSRVGGLIGQLNGGTIENCYSRCTVSGDDINGGLIGNIVTGTPSVINCYSADPGNLVIVGNTQAGSYPDFNSCYYDVGDGKSYGVGKSTSEMKMQSTFIGWDFVNTWKIDNTQVINDGYPYLSTGGPSPSVPLSNWALYFSIILMGLFTIIWLKRILFS